VTFRLAEALAPGLRVTVGDPTTPVHPLGTPAVKLNVDAPHPELSLFFTETVKGTLVPADTQALCDGESEIVGFVCVQLEPPLAKVIDSVAPVLSAEVVLIVVPETGSVKL
jgi:hypothetical protein